MKIRSIENYKKLLISRTDPQQLIISWLGQAGFLFKFNGKNIFIDPYLSDFLAKKYKAKLFPHIRLMKTPLKPEDAINIDYVLSTHPHSDHMDPETLTPIVRNNPKCQFIIPKPELEEAQRRGVDLSHTIPAIAHEIIKIDEEISIIPIPASHEEFKMDTNHNHSYLGYVFRFGRIKVYHSGDCIPYEGLSKTLESHNLDIALLPINGRDEYRLENNIAGNFTIPEVVHLSQDIGINTLIVHHFGMFAYNTVTDEVLNRLRKMKISELQIIIPELYSSYIF